MKKTNNKLLLLIVFLALFSGMFFLLNSYKNSRINEILDEQSKYLELSYKQGLDRFNVISDNIYLYMQNDKEFVDILANADKNNLKLSHDKLFQHLQAEFSRLKMSGIMGLQIVLPNNISLLRMHKVDKYGDDLSTMRYILKYVNEEKVHISGFEEGRTSHAFREIYPIYNDGKYIGLIEIFFSSTKLQDYTMRASDIHTHFIVNKNVFKSNAWKSNIVEPYRESIEHKDFLFSMNDHIKHDRLESSKASIIDPLRKEIDKGVLNGEAFNLYVNTQGSAKILAFIPIKRFKDSKTVAYLVSYTTSEKLSSFLDNVKIFFFFMSLFMIVVYLIIYRLLGQKEKIIDELKYDALTNVYNRKYFMHDLEKEYKILVKREVPFCLVMVDIDFFKNVNDTYGHQYGDIVLKEFATILKDSVRSVDKVSRYGGEEFIIFLLTNEENSFNIVDNIRKKIEAFEFGIEKIKLTASFGVAECKSENTSSEIIKRADDALYDAKEKGRNRIEIG